MILSLGPVDGIFVQTFNLVYLLDKTKPWFVFGDLNPVFKITGEFSQRIRLESVDGFYLT